MIRRRKPRFYKGQLKDLLCILLSQRVAQGPYIQLFEERFAQYIGVKFALSTCSGRNGLEILLSALELEEADEVIVPAYTLKDLIYLIKNNKLVPKLVDIEPNSFNINPDLLEDCISEKTKLIIATHLFGLPCNMEKILAIAKKYNVKVIEDCAHSLGTDFKNKKVGSLADAGFFSFEVLKPINTFGGGMITTNDTCIAKKARQFLKSYPFRKRTILTKVLFTYLEYLVLVSPLYLLIMFLFRYKTTTRLLSKIYVTLHRKTNINHERFTNLQALMGLRQLERLDENNKKRSMVAKRLQQALPEEVTPQHSQFSDERIFYFFVVNTPHKNAIEKIRKNFIQAGIDAGIKHEITDNCAQILKIDNQYPVAKKAYNYNLQLPIHDDLKDKEINTIINATKKIFYCFRKLKI